MMLRQKTQRSRESALKCITSSVKHGGGSVMGWARMATTGTTSIVLNNDVTADRSNRINYEEQSCTLCLDSQKCCKTDQIVLPSAHG